MLALSVIALCIPSSAPGGDVAPSGDSGAQAPQGRVAGADCSDDRKGLRYYRHWRGVWRARMESGLPPGLERRATSTPLEAARVTRSPADLRCPQIHRLAELARWNAYKARWYYERWHERLQRRLANPTQAILYVFGAYGQEALRVASCESGRGIYARNGQYLGIFQMGDYARSRFGHSWTALGQARAAYRYFVLSGRDWSPWSCKP